MARHVGYQYFSVVMIALSIVIATGVESNYTLDILLLSYENPSHMAKSLENFRAGCCELDMASPCRSCDNAFSVCVREVRLGVVEGDCDLVEESTLIAEDDDDLMFTIGEDIGGLSNPLTVSGEMWPGTVEILFTVFDLDLITTIESTSDVVDTVFIYPYVPAGLSANDPFSDPMIFTGNANYSHFELAFRLTCGPHFYGPDCTFCVPSNDSTGHYSCDDRTGNKVCLEGYQGPETNCTDCVPASDCNHDGGYCILPGDCLCHGGFTGEYCDLYTITTHPSTTSMHSTTKAPTSTSPPTETLDVYASVGLASGAILIVVVVAVVLMNVTVCWCWVKRNRANETKPVVLYDYINDPPTYDPNILQTTNPAYVTTTPVPVSTNEAYGMCTNDVSSETHMTINEAYGDATTGVPVYEECGTTTDVHTSTNEAYAATTVP